MDMVRIFQVFFIQRAFRGKVDFKIGDVNENLGQVEYILAGKTGTITEKEVNLKMCFIGNSKFTRDDEEFDKSQTFIYDSKQNFTKVISDNTSKLLSRSDSERSEFVSDIHRPYFQRLKQVVFKDDNSIISQFLKCVALCNAVTPSEDGFVGISNDEITMAEAAFDIGMKLTARTKISCELDAVGTKEEYIVLASSPYSSSTKKSRILVKSNKEAVLYVKGSYNEMIKIIESLTSD